MDDVQYKRFQKDMKNHTKKCWKCGNPKRNTCKQTPCLAQHCACAMTDPDITD